VPDTDRAVILTASIRAGRARAARPGGPAWRHCHHRHRGRLEEYCGHPKAARLRTASTTRP